MQIEDLIDRTFSHLRRCGFSIGDRRRPGLSASSIAEALRESGLQAPNDLIDLYKCCDGTSTFEGDVLREIQFFPGYYWMSLNDALDVYRSISESGDWERSWLPIFANGGGDFYAVICDDMSPYFGEVVGFILGEPDQIVEFKSVLCMIETLEHAFAEGVFFILEGQLKADYAKMRSLARRVQPGFLEHVV